MKFVLEKILRLIGWQKMLAMVWDMVDDDIKAKVQKTDPKWDDEAFKIIDSLVKDLTAVK